MATDVWHLQALAPPPEQRRSRRAIAVTRASVRGHGDPPAEAELMDLSIYGCRLKAPGWWDEDDRLWLRFDGGWPIAASVVWSDGERLGCRFDQPIAQSMMRELTRSLI